MLKDVDNRLVFIALEPGERLRSEAPRIEPDPDSMRKRSDLILEFKVTP